MGISVSVPWDADGELGVTIAPAPQEKWYISTDIDPAAASHYDVMESIVAWANGAGRAWYGAATFAWTLTDESPQYGVRLSCTTSATFAVGSLGPLNWPATTTAAYVESTAGCDGTCDAVFRVEPWLPMIEMDGLRSGAGSYIPDSQVYAAASPEIEAVVTEAQLLALTRAYQVSSDPRTARIHRKPTDTWCDVHLGELGQPSRGIQLYRVSLSGVG